MLLSIIDACCTLYHWQIGVCVVAGNVRRTAEIAFGDPESQEYVDLKDYHKNPARAEFGWASNNSVMARLGMDYTEVIPHVVTIILFEALFLQRDLGASVLSTDEDLFHPLYPVCRWSDSCLARTNRAESIDRDAVGPRAPLYQHLSFPVILTSATLLPTVYPRDVGHEVGLECLEGRLVLSTACLPHPRKVCKRVSMNGEPGFAWLENMRAYGRMGDAKDHRDTEAMGGNPCLEQTLESFEMCCLVETFPHKHDDLQDFLETLRQAAVVSYLARVDEARRGTSPAS